MIITSLNLFRHILEVEFLATYTVLQPVQVQKCEILTAVLKFLVPCVPNIHLPSFWIFSRERGISEGAHKQLNELKVKLNVGRYFQG